MPISAKYFHIKYFYYSGEEEGGCLSLIVDFQAFDYFPGIYFLLSLALVGCSCLMTVIVLKVHFSGRKQHRMPKWISACILRPLAKVLCMDLNGYLKPEKKWTQVLYSDYIPIIFSENCSYLCGCFKVVM